MVSVDPGWLNVLRRYRVAMALWNLICSRICRVARYGKPAIQVRSSSPHLIALAEAPGVVARRVQRLSDPDSWLPEGVIVDVPIAVFAALALLQRRYFLPRHGGPGV